MVVKIHLQTCATTLARRIYMATRILLIVFLITIALPAASALAREATSRYVKDNGYVLVYE